MSVSLRSGFAEVVDPVVPFRFELIRATRHCGLSASPTPKRRPSGLIAAHRGHSGEQGCHRLALSPQTSWPHPFPLLAFSPALPRRSASSPVRLALRGLSGLDSTSSEPVNDPVCVAAARLPASVRPGLMTIIGLFNATSRAAERKARAWPTL